MDALPLSRFPNNTCRWCRARRHEQCGFITPNCLKNQFQCDTQLIRTSRRASSGTLWNERCENRNSNFPDRNLSRSTQSASKTGSWLGESMGLYGCITILSNSVTVFTSAIMNIDPFSSLHQFRLINYQETKRAWSQKICKEYATRSRIMNVRQNFSRCWTALFCILAQLMRVYALLLSLFVEIVQ